MIVAVAIWNDGKLYSLPRPNRHHHVIRLIYKETGAALLDDEQGFLDDEGYFLTREQAHKIAVECGQVRRQLPPILFSEDVW